MEETKNNTHLNSLRRIMLHGLLRMRAGLLEPEKARDLAVRPEGVRDGGEEGEGLRGRGQ
jgi:hypothetical protein